jgi:PAS domain S-box-containing protein
LSSGAPPLRTGRAILWALVSLSTLAWLLAAAHASALWPLAVAGAGLTLGGAWWLHRQFGADITGEATRASGPLDYQAFVEQLPDALVLCDAQGVRIAYVNQAALTLCGATQAGEVVGLSLTAFMRDDEQEAHTAHMEAFLASKRRAGRPRQMHLRRRDGEERAVEVVASRITLEGASYVALTLWDVTARERNEAHKAYLASFPELTPTPVLEVTPDGRVVYANPAAHACFSILNADNPLLRRVPAFKRALTRGAGSVEARVQVEGRTYEARAYRAPDSENVRIYAQDVTLQQEALVGLSESREKFSRVFLGSPVPLVVMRVHDGVFVDLNEAFVRLVGGESRAQFLDRTPSDVGFWRTPHERRGQVLLFRNLPIEGRVTTMRRLDTGEERRVELWADRIVVGGEECWAGVFLDIEAHLQAEEALQAERDRFAFVNPAFARLIGANADALLGQPIEPFVVPDDRAHYHTETGRRGAGEASSYEIRFLHADGKPRPVLVTGVPIHAGRYAGGVAAVITDLAMFKAAQAEVQHLKDFYESILEHLPLRVVVFDGAGHLAFANAEVVSDEARRARLLGKPVVEAMRAAGLSAEAAERLRQHLDEARRTGDVQTWEEQTGSSESERTLLFAVRPLSEPSASYVGYALDVTERRRYEQGLVEARERAEELAQLKSAFLANMSHEVRTPLAGIIGFAEVLEDELEGPQREAAALVRESGMRLLDTLNSVLDLARLESDATELRLVPLDVRPEVEAIARLFGPTAERKGLTFGVQLPDDNAPLEAMLDSAAFHRVLANLVSNAIKFTDRGGITLEVAREAGGLAVRVRDTGSGISETFLPHVFEEFRQESSGLTRAHQGSGLGLAITKRLVDLLHATISVESTVGAGTTFTVRFPALDAGGAASALAR